ncbi:MAG: hypothetical protein ACFE7R_07940, partial [Candidatus Hodarchaeota archaeon]
MAFGSKYFGWLAAMAIVLGAGWLLLPEGYNTLIQWLAPLMGNYVRPTMVMVNLMLVNPLYNIPMVIVWAAAGFIGGIIAGTKKGAAVVGIFTWLASFLILVFCVFMMLTAGFDLGSIPPMPPGSSLLDLLDIPLVQSVIGDIVPILMGGFGGGSFDPFTLLLPLVVWFVVPIVIVIVAGIIGAMIRPKE